MKNVYIVHGLYLVRHQSNEMDFEQWFNWFS